MRKIPALLAVLGMAALSLAGCTSSADACERPAAADPGLQEQITVAGEFGSAPTIDIYTPTIVAEQTTWETITGEGTPITAENQSVVIDVTLVSAQTGALAASTAYGDDLSRVTTISQWVETFPEFTAAMTCARPGSRVVIALPPSGLAEGAGAGWGLDEDDSTVAVVDVRKVYLTRANGANQFVSDRNMPAIVRAPDGRPGVIVPDAAPPTETTVQVLKKGTGDVVDGSAPVRVNYTSVSWDDPKVLATTWDTNATAVTLDESAPDGFAEALQGQTVGSQVVLVLPAATSGSDPATVYVIDILGIDAVPPTG